MSETTTTMSPDQLAAAIDAERAPLMLDVRTPAEHATVHVPGSINVPLDMLQQHREQLAAHLADSGDDVVLLCQSGRRAGQAAQGLAAVGSEATVLDGGVSAMDQQHDRLTRRAGDRWAMDRQVRMAAGSLVLTGFLGGKLVSPAIGYLAGAVGAGLTYSALSDSCAMAKALDKMPWNRDVPAPSIDDVFAAMPTTARRDGTER